MTDLPSSKPADETRPDAATLRVTTELELVIAGALLFGLLKIPALIDSWWLEARPHVSGAILLLLKPTLLPDVNAFALGFGVAAVTLLPMSLAGLVDLKLKERLDPQGKLGRSVSLLLRGSYYISLGPVVFPLLLTFATRFRRRTFYPLLAIVGAAVVGAFLLRMLAAEGSGPARELPPLSRAAHGAFPRRSAVREPATRRTLLLPGAFHPVGHRHRSLRAPVPSLLPAPRQRSPRGALSRRATAARRGPVPRSGGTRAEDLRIALDCLASMHDVSINGEPLQTPRYHFYEDPASGAHGIVTHLSTAALPTGYNEIRVVRRASKADQGRPRQLERVLYVIPFWR